MYLPVYQFTDQGDLKYRFINTTTKLIDRSYQQRPSLTQHLFKKLQNVIPVIISQYKEIMLYVQKLPDLNADMAYFPTHSLTISAFKSGSFYTYNIISWYWLIITRITFCSFLKGTKIPERPLNQEVSTQITLCLSTG